jgi:hypothetical protein
MLPPAQLIFPFAAEDERRMMPTDFIGAALFSALNRSAKPIYINKLTEIARMHEYRLVYRGRVLTQAHADVWLAIVEIFRRRATAVNGTAEFKSGEMLRIIGREPNVRSRADLFGYINDMIVSQVHLYAPGGSTRVWLGGVLTGELDGELPLVDIIKRLDAGLSIGEIRYKLMLHPQLRDAFARGYTGIDWAHRRAIGKNELALWMHHYLAAVREPTSVSELHHLSWQNHGERQDPKSVAKSRAAFRHRLKEALRTLRELKLLRQWKVDESDRLHVLMPSQLRLRAERMTRALP